MGDLFRHLDIAMYQTNISDRNTLSPYDSST